MPGWDWTRDELVLAVDLVIRRNWRAVRAGEPDAERLSAVLRALTIHPLEGRPEQFRSPSSVQRKTYDIVTGQKDFAGVPTKGATAQERAVAAEFQAQPDRLHAEAARLRKFGGDLT